MTDALRGVDDEGLPVIPPPRVRGDHTRGLAGLAGLGVGLSVGRKVLMLVYSVLFVRLLGVDLYALFVAFDTVARPLGTVGAVGGANVLIKEISEARAQGNERRARHVILSSLILILLVSGAIAAIVSIEAPTIARWMGGLPYLESLLRVGSAYIVLLALMTALSGALTGYGRTAAMFTLTNGVEPMFKLLGLPVVALLLVWVPAHWPWVIVPEMLSMVAVLALGAFYLRRDSAFAVRPSLELPGEILRLTSTGIPLLVHSLSSIAFTYADRAMVASMIGDALSLSAYSITVTLSLLLILFHRNLVTAVSPAVSAAVAANDRARLVKIYRDSSAASFILAGTGYLLLLIFGREVLAAYDPRFSAYLMLIGVMAWGHLVDTFAGCGGYLLIARGKGRYLMYNSIGTVALNIVMNYYFIRWYGLTGAAAATALSYVAKNLIIMIQNYMTDRIHPISRLHALNFVLAAAGAVLLWDVSETVSLPWRLLLGTGVAAGGMAMLWVAFPDSATPFLRRLRKRRP